MYLIPAPAKLEKKEGRFIWAYDRYVTVDQSCSQLVTRQASLFCDGAEKELGYELLERRHGGKSGGKCTVTEKGKSLMKRYRQMEKETRDCLQKSFEKYFPEYQRIR